MTVREIPNDFDLRANAQPRSPGRHVSEVIREIALVMGTLKREDQEELDWTLAKYRLRHGDRRGAETLFPVAIYRVALGLAWEEWLGGQWPHIGFHALGELERDGLAGTPDGLEFQEQPDGTFRGIIHEIKLTWKSSRSDRESPEERIGHEWMWQGQTKAYCHMASQPGYPVLWSHLHVYWVNGNYRGSGPESRSYELGFTAEELRRNWQLIKQTSQRLMPA